VLLHYPGPHFLLLRASKPNRGLLLTKVFWPYKGQQYLWHAKGINMSYPWYNMALLREVDADNKYIAIAAILTLTTPAPWGATLD
jgi:hypothetical protein